MQSKYRHLRIGLVGLGLEAYWSQFAGLEERLKGYLNEVDEEDRKRFADGGEPWPGRYPGEGAGSGAYIAGAKTSRFCWCTSPPMHFLQRCCR